VAKLVLTFNKQVIREYPFVKDHMTIGRKPENDIQIDNLAVSGHHSRIDKAGSRFVLTDLGSTNGTFIKNKKITSHVLTQGDHIQIGKHVILFLTSRAEGEKAAREVAFDGLDKTMVLDTARQRELLSEQGGPTEPEKPERIGVLTFLNGTKEGEILLTKKLTRIGKSSSAEINLPGMFMAHTAATISRRPSGYTITFTGGVTKLKVNGKVVQDSVPLKDFDTIEIGSYKSQFYHQDVVK
jgi:pSer/pThr/pTyr-binding forkhead associated (FHA) protein